MCNNTRGGYNNHSTNNCSDESYTENIIVNNTSSNDYPINNMTLEEVARLVDIEAKHIKGNSNRSYEELAALSAMQFSNTFISGYRVNEANRVPEYNQFEGNCAEQGWYYSSGYCAVKAYAMMDILKYLGIPTREIQFWHINGKADSHCTCEVYYNEAWHYFDPTWSLFFKDTNNIILSLQEILSLPKNVAYSYVVMDNTNIQNYLVDYKESQYNLLETKADIGINGNSEIVIDFDYITQLASAPAYIGIKLNWNDEISEVKYKINLDTNIKEINIYYDTSKTNTKQINVVDNDDNIILSEKIDKENGIININNLPLNYIRLEVADKENCNLLFINRIEAVYENGGKTFIE